MERLELTPQLQGMVDFINNTPINLGVVPVEPHPMLSISHTRELVIYKIIPNLEVLRTDIYYNQVIKDLEGNIIPSSLPKPDWIISASETSSIRDAENNRETVKVLVTDEEGVDAYKKDENGDDVLVPVLVNSHKFLCMLLQTNSVGIVTLLQNYLYEKLIVEPEFKARLNSLV